MKHLLDKQERLTVQFWISTFLVLSGIAILFVGMFIPPVGVIDWSVLTAYGEVSTFAGSLIGIDYSYKKERLKHGKNDEERA